jgi:hypothetical protein
LSRLGLLRCVAIAAPGGYVRLTSGLPGEHRLWVRNWLASSTLSVALACASASCAADPSELAPTEALTAFLAALERSTHAPDQRRLAYDWLDLASQRMLAQRARLSSSLAGRPFEPWDMLVPGRVSFAAQSLAGARLRANVDGEHATIEIPAEKSVIPPPATKVAMVREAGRWRVALPLASAL